jgi:membrane-associated protein
MDLLKEFLNIVLHLGDNLTRWSNDWGPWLYAVLFLVIFCETGLVVTPFLPGDSLLFAVGAVAAREGSTLSLPALFALLVAAAVLGDAVNYYLGLKVGPAVFRSEKSRLFNCKHLLRTQQFYERYGGKTIVLARFIPIIRTFAPFVAGIGKMRYRRFAAYNVLGAVAWVAICVFSGYFFGNLRFELFGLVIDVRQNFELVLVAIILISVMPMVVEFFLARRGRGDVAPAEPTLPAAPRHGPAATLEAAVEAPAGEPQ